MSGKLGATSERELVNALDAVGYSAVRIPASGGATDRELPDVLAGRPRLLVEGFESYDDGSSLPSETTTVSEALAIEHKSTSSTTAYVTDSEVDDLLHFAHRFGAKPLIGAKFKRPGGTRSAIWLVEPDECRMTEAGSYGVPESDVESRAWARLYPATDNQAAELEVSE